MFHYWSPFLLLLKWQDHHIIWESCWGPVFVNKYKYPNLSITRYKSNLSSLHHNPEPMWCQLVYSCLNPLIRNILWIVIHLSMKEILLRNASSGIWCMWKLIDKCPPFVYSNSSYSICRCWCNVATYICNVHNQKKELTTHKVSASKGPHYPFLGIC